MDMTLEADYAVRIVELLSDADQRIDAHTISEKTQVPLRFALKILRKLVTDGLVKSYKGARGGYVIGRDPATITLREVIESVEGPYMLSRCQQDAYCCTNHSCRVHKVYAEISKMVRDKLDEYTFGSVKSRKETLEVPKE